MNPNIFESMESQKNAYNKELKNIFAKKIKPSFMIDVKERILKQFGKELFHYFRIDYGINAIVTGIHDSSIEYDLCRIIIGCHRSNCIFKSELERAELQKSEDYKKKLVNQVIEEIKLRPYSGFYFRKNQLIGGDEFLFFPALYKVYAMCMYSLNKYMTISQNKKMVYYYDIFSKSLATMTMIENNFMDSAYPLLRGVIELFVKNMFLHNEEALIDEIELFKEWETQKTATEEYPEDFKLRYKSRKVARCSMVEYLHYGWVDSIHGYHDAIKSNAYSMKGLFDYLKTKDDNIRGQAIGMIKTIYQRCHGFAHGNIGNHGYPLLHYFELTIGLVIVISVVYESFCEDAQIEKNINGIDVLDSVREDFVLLIEQYKKRTTENFDNYYLHS